MNTPRLPTRNGGGAQTPVLGIDTSLRSTGVGVIAFQGTRGAVMAAERIRNPRQRSLSECLAFLQTEMERIITATRPASAALEGVFVRRNTRSALILGHARGVAIACCARAGIPTYEYEPRRVKQAVVGFGGAGKSQVQKMILTLLGLPETPQEDIADALAVAFCHWHTCSGARFINANPL